jgi:hypothetical protein
MTTYKRKDRKFMDRLAAMRDRLTDPKWMGARIVYRLLRDYNGQPKTLYHAHGDSMILPLDTWLQSKPKIVHNPGKAHTGAKGFRAGFHVFPTLEDLVKYSRNMDKSYAVVEVVVSGKIRPKPRSRSTVLLAEHMLLTSGCWDLRLPLNAFLGGIE